MVQVLRRAHLHGASRWGLTDVYAAVIPGFQFKAAVHVNYQETVLPIKDGVPKFKDLPKEDGWFGRQHP